MRENGDGSTVINARLMFRFGRDENESQRKETNEITLGKGET